MTNVYLVLSLSLICQYFFIYFNHSLTLFFGQNFKERVLVGKKMYSQMVKTRNLEDWTTSRHEEKASDTEWLMLKCPEKYSRSGTSFHSNLEKQSLRRILLEFSDHWHCEEDIRGSHCEITCW